MSPQLIWRGSSADVPLSEPSHLPCCGDGWDSAIVQSLVEKGEMRRVFKKSQFILCPRIKILTPHLPQAHTCTYASTSPARTGPVMNWAPKRLASALEKMSSISRSTPSLEKVETESEIGRGEVCNGSESSHPEICVQEYSFPFTYGIAKIHHVNRSAVSLSHAQDPHLTFPPT